MTRRATSVLLALALAGLAGCATAPPPAPGTTAPPAVSKPGGSGNAAQPRPASRAASRDQTAPSPAVVDSEPSQDALDVLATIPEPLTAAERSEAAAALRAAEEALRAAAPAIASEDTLIPVPAPTAPLGDRPGRARVVADTMPAMPPPPPAQPASPAAAAVPDSCWRIQVAAPTDQEEAELKRQAAESVLLVSFVIEQDQKRFKVRSRDCLSREASAQLRRRAIDSGFEGSFPVLVTKK